MILQRLRSISKSSEIVYRFHHRHSRASVVHADFADVISRGRAIGAERVIDIRRGKNEQNSPIIILVIYCQLSTLSTTIA